MKKKKKKEYGSDIWAHLGYAQLKQVASWFRCCEKEATNSKMLATSYWVLSG